MNQSAFSVIYGINIMYNGQQQQTHTHSLSRQTSKAPLGEEHWPKPVLGNKTTPLTDTRLVSEARGRVTTSENQLKTRRLGSLETGVGVDIENTQEKNKQKNIHAQPIYV